MWASAAAAAARSSAGCKLVVSPYNKYHVLDIAAKGTVRNKEVLSRNHYQRLADVDLESFRELIEQWVLDYAELYSAAV